jgi:hypothetical protein
MSSLDALLDKPFYERAVVLLRNAISVTGLRLDDDIYGIHGDAVRSFLCRDFLPSIFYSSIGVEMYLNKDKRLKNSESLRRWNGWVNLNREALVEADKLGLPVAELLGESEKKLLEEGKGSDPSFILRRNKILHGDFRGLMTKELPEVTQIGKKLGEGDYSAILNTQEAAFDQLLKFQKLLMGSHVVMSLHKGNPP